MNFVEGLNQFEYLVDFIIFIALKIAENYDYLCFILRLQYTKSHMMVAICVIIISQFHFKQEVKL